MDNTWRTNWSKADLCQRNFVGYCADLPASRLVIKTLGLFSLLTTSGVLAAFAAIFATSLLGSETTSLDAVFAGITVVGLAITGLVVTFRKGFTAFLGLSVATFAVLGILLLILRTSPVIDAFGLIPLTITSELLALWLSGVAIASGRALFGRISIGLEISALSGTGITLFLVGHFSVIKPNWADNLIAVSILITGGVIGWNVFTPSSQFPGIAKLAINLTAIGGTSFRQANLSESDFSGATLKHTDFRDANLMRTCWHAAKGLEFARLGNTYLANPRACHQIGEEVRWGRGLCPQSLISGRV